MLTFIVQDMFKKRRRQSLHERKLVGRYRSLLTLTLLCSAYLCSHAQQNAGNAPALSLGARDIFAEFHLPPFKDGPHDSLRTNLQTTQVFARATRLGVSSRSAIEAWRKSELTFSSAKATAEAPDDSKSVAFTGTRASALNVLLADPAVTRVQVLSYRLSMDVPLLIRRDNVNLDLAKSQLRMKPGAPYMIRVEGAHSVRITGGRLVQGQWGVLVLRSRSVTILGMRAEGLSGGGVLLSSCRDCVVWSNAFLRLGGAPIMLHGETIGSTIAHNTISGNLNPSNWRAGIVITDRNADLQAAPDSLLNPDLFGVREDPMANRLKIPHDNVIAFNELLDNQSSAIYSDGGARNIFASNRIEANSKEGICLDNGSLANVVAYNTFQSNGKRWGKTDFELQREFVFNFGRLPDGSSPAKVPAISMDNAAYNVLLCNQINGNFGGGIKLVRTDFFNTIGMNTITDNNRGVSDRFHFFGIEVGAAKADVPVKDLDFLPGHGNIIFANLIRGDHYAGIFFAAGSDSNDIFDNSIFGASNWAMESVVRQANNTLNNLTNQPSRNIDPGLDPRLREMTAAHFDKP